MVKSNQLTLQQKNSMVSVGFVVSVQHFSSSNVCTSQHFFSSVLCVFRIFSCKYLTISYFQNTQTNYTSIDFYNKFSACERSIFAVGMFSGLLTWVRLLLIRVWSVDFGLFDYFVLSCTISFHQHRIVHVGSFAPNAACFSVDIVLCSSFHDKIWQQI